MNPVSTGYEDSGRSRQKQRTRAALVASTRDLVSRSGSAPKVAEAAAAAGVSRTTAYRYFPSQHALLIAAHPEVEAPSMLVEGMGEDDVAARVEAVVRRFLAVVVDTEPQQRTMLRLSLSEGVDRAALPLRQGRAIGWISEALEPWRKELGEDGVRRLAVAVRAACGIEALVWLIDVAGLDRHEAVEQMVWSAVALIRRAEAEGPPVPRRPKVERRARRPRNEAGRR
jgi:AcrR family transcriptional regulator